MGEVNENPTFRDKVISIATKDDVIPSELSADLAIEQFADCRNYPSSYSEDKITADMERNLFKIAMATLEIDAREGGEGEISHSEGGVNRSYGDNPLPKAYATVVPIVNVI